ncbi:MAG: hypothetical protein CM15mP100_1640 [Alphaproteobacteria bacterium]|nr:MAG: hypothetical protein CM15mP100_1640 [Alphaproteobacteria bacterium]
MIKRLFTLLTATAFLAACETASTTTGDATSSAQSSSTNTATTASSSSSSSSLPLPQVQGIRVQALRASLQK